MDENIIPIGPTAQELSKRERLRIHLREISISPNDLGEYRPAYKPPKLDGSRTWAQIFRGVESKEKKEPVRAFHGFKKLPLELRAKVWSHYLQGELGETIDPRDHMYPRHWNIPPSHYRFPSFLTRAALSSWSTMPEVAAVLLETKTFVVASLYNNIWFTNWLTSMRAFGHVRSLHFKNFGNFIADNVESADMKLLHRCTGLRAVTLCFHVNTLSRYPEEGEGLPENVLVAIEPEVLWMQYQLESLLQCSMLETITIEHIGSGSRKEMSMVGKAGLVSHMKTVFDERRPVPAVELRASERKPWVNPHFTTF